MFRFLEPTSMVFGATARAFSLQLELSFAESHIRHGRHWNKDAGCETSLQTHTQCGHGSEFPCKTYGQTGAKPERRHCRNCRSADYHWFRSIYTQMYTTAFACCSLLCLTVAVLGRKAAPKPSKQCGYLGAAACVECHC
eukprot:4721518-Amphidinium_carterae.1